VFLIKASTVDLDTSPAGVAAQNAAAVARATQNAARSAGSAAQTTAAGVSKGLRQGVYNARGWAAPRLEGAADYCTTTVAPTVSTALRTTARKVGPANAVNPARHRSASALTWSLLGVAILAAAGAGAAMVRYRYRAAMAIDSETDAETGITSEPAAADPASASQDGTAPVAPAAQAGVS
jgi:hypothetical protein